MQSCPFQCLTNVLILFEEGQNQMTQSDGLLMTWDDVPSLMFDGSRNDEVRVEHEMVTMRLERKSVNLGAFENYKI